MKMQHIVFVLSVSATAAHAADDCVTIYKGAHSEVGVGGSLLCWTPPEAAFDLDDTSIGTPAGGPNSLPNEVIRKSVTKPARWLKNRLGL